MKRFWSDVGVIEDDGGFGVALDGRPVRTPGKSHLTLPTRALADALAQEWRDQDDTVDPATMPLTRAANSAVDRVAAQFEDVLAMLVEYGETDLLIYRADRPDALAQRQADAWDPWIDWANTALGVRLTPVVGVIPQAQDPGNQTRFRSALAPQTPLALTGIHDLVTLSGSLVLGLAVARGALAADEGWTLSRIDETWQAEQWGRDAEAEEAAERKRAEFLQARKLLDLL